MVKIGKYDYQKSDRRGKKLMTVVKGKEVHFGDAKMQHYFDKTELLSKSLNHLDKKRRESYLKRSKGIKDGDGKLTWKDPSSPNYHSIRILW